MQWTLKVVKGLKGKNMQEEACYDFQWGILGIPL